MLPSHVQHLLVFFNFTFQLEMLNLLNLMDC